MILRRTKKTTTEESNDAPGVSKARYTFCWFRDHQHVLTAKTGDGWIQFHAGPKSSAVTHAELEQLLKELYVELIGD